MLISPFGSSKVLLFSIEESPFTQACNLIIGKLLGAISAVFSFDSFGNNSFSCGLAAAITMALGQLFRYVHPPSGVVALLVIIYKANLDFVLSTVLLGSFVLIPWGIINRIFNKKTTYSFHWI